MRFGRLRIVLFSVFTATAATAAFAQAHGGKPAPEPVSPGGVDRLRPTSTCPTFNWAPVDGAPAYELSVFPLENRQTLADDPALRVLLPGRSAGWTPSGTSCLSAGEYVWFIRQVASTGEPISAWSSGLAISVPDAPSAPAVSTPTASTQKNATAAAAKTGGTPGGPAAGGHNGIQDTLDDINAKLDDLLAPVSRQICFEVGAALELGTEFGGDLDGEFEGRVGAEGFGNGVMGKVKAKPGWGFAAALKGSANPKFSICRDLGARASATMSSSQTRAATGLSGAAGLTDDEFTTRVLALADKLQMNDDRVAAALDALPDFSGKPDAWSALGADGPVSKLADVMPLPDALRETLRDPAQIVANLRTQLALCSQSGLPPAVNDLIQEFCGFAKSERFSQLLDRVDGAVSTVNKTVGTIQTDIDNIIDRLPTSGDCKFFCK